MTLRITAKDLPGMEADIGRRAEVEVRIDSRGVLFTATIAGRGSQENLSAAYMLSRHQVFYLNAEENPLPEITDQLRKMIQKELHQDSE